MPYRRLPNTDKARMRAIETAYEIGKKTVPTELAFNQKLFIETSKMYDYFQHFLEIKKESYKNRIAVNKIFNKQFKKTKLYLSHFIQVFNMAIQRNEIDQSERRYFDIKPDDHIVPEILTIEDILYWGEKIINGNMQRELDNKNRIYNPKPALVKIEFENFRDILQRKNKLTSVHERYSDNIKEIRQNCDKLICQIWDKTEEYYSDFPSEKKRELSANYGVVYVERKKEKQLKNLI
ncbi:MAG: hypothetical protein U9N85_00665 [Bacteroidota bacterium]|nr:hypothetical protein [Bacteroidota bacterium]